MVGLACRGSVQPKLQLTHSMRHYVNFRLAIQPALRSRTGLYTRANSAKPIPMTNASGAPAALLLGAGFLRAMRATLQPRCDSWLAKCANVWCSIATTPYGVA